MRNSPHGTCVVVLGLLSSHGLLAQDLAEPEELQDPGGVLYVNAGETVEFEDEDGRVWMPDELFFAPTQGATNMYRNDVDIDLTLVEEDEIPRELFIVERWCDCDFEYQLAVPNATYEVTLYFAEIWDSCVPAELGGTNADPNASRLFNIEIEGEVLAENFSQADTAEEDPDDGIGAIHKAVQLAFEVTVDDDILDIRFDDLGGGNPPENAAVKGLRILHREEAEEEVFQRGDADGNGAVELTDAVNSLSGQFLGTFMSRCRDAEDFDDNGLIDITDPIGLLSFLFLGMQQVPAPGADACGTDPTEDELDCAAYPVGLCP